MPARNRQSPHHDSTTEVNSDSPRKHIKLATMDTTAMDCYLLSKDGNLSSPASSPTRTTGKPSPHPAPRVSLSTCSPTRVSCPVLRQSWLFTRETPANSCLMFFDAELGNEAADDLSPARTAVCPSSWPKHTLPNELYGQIATHLSFADCCHMRLVNQEFNAHMTEVLLQAFTLIFRPSIVRPGSQSNSHLMKLGHHFRRLAFASEVSDFDVACAPAVASQTIIKSWWGVYRWPVSRAPTSIFSELSESCQNPYELADVLEVLIKVHSLGLCLDSGLGYLSGSMIGPANYSAVFPNDADNDPHVLLADANGTPLDEDTANNACRILRKMFSDADFTTEDDIKEGIRLLGIHEGRLVTDWDLANPFPRARAATGTPPVPPPPRNMASLEQSQMWMLVQSQLVHRSLLSCLSEALLQAPDFAIHILTLRISKLSSSLIPSLSTHTFWESLPNVHSLFLGVVPDWRRIDSHGTTSPGCQHDTDIAPVSALGPVFDLLNDYVAPRANITTVHFEWVCGGELVGDGSQRNRYILPAPLAKSVDDMLLPSHEIQRTSLLLLPHVRSLSLRNAWTTADVLFKSITSMNRSQLRRLELESFSLSGPSRHAGPRQKDSILASKVKEILETKPAAVPFQIHADKPPTYEPSPPGNTDVLSQELAPRIAHAANPSLAQLRTPSVLAYHSPGTWAHFVDFFTPGQTILDFQRTSETQTPARTKAHPQLLDMSFKSCGYVFIGDPRVDNSPLLPRLAYSNLSSLLILNRPGDRVNNTIAVPSSVPTFQVPKEGGLLGDIIRYLDPNEAITLERVFSFSQTWHGVYPITAITEAYDQGVMQWREVGAGRFSGTIAADLEKRVHFLPVIDYEA
ncbi:hypothetical protein MKZ38_000713 [Zalerion maritima]|uniref:F-box domain-containing protein n=1 Tax=Zalerion maritima TaxID=339359 RepID=A0AAD5WUA2_9PEZI|nr:hypothetical protein MKZ38_000713 [Zalerion maritima]